MHRVGFRAALAVFLTASNISGYNATSRVAEDSTRSGQRIKQPPSAIATSRIAATETSSITPKPQKQTYIYKTVKQCDIRADVYRPLQVSGRTPVIIWIHGGALIFGSRTDIRTAQLSEYLQAGYTVVAVDYRLAPEVKLPSIIEDLRDAFRWVREKGPSLFQADPERIAAIGHSAGGYLTLMSGFCVSPRPKVLVSFYGYGDIAGDWVSKPDPFYRRQPLEPREHAYGGVSGLVVSEAPANHRLPFYLYCRQQGIWSKEVSGYDPQKEPAVFVGLCPLRNVSTEYPPTLFLHGDKDTDVPYQQSVDMATELARFRVEHELVTIPDGPHVFDRDMQNPRSRKALKAVLAFLKKHL